MDRRQFVCLGVGSSLYPLGVSSQLLTGAWLWLCLPFRKLHAEVLPACHYLRTKDVPILERLLPCVVGTEVIDLMASVRRLDCLLRQLSQANRDQLLLLLDLLDFPLSRILLGLWPDWQRAKAEEIDKLLLAWENSQLPIKRFAYQSLVQIIMFAHYSHSETQKTVGYRGPPDVILPFLAHTGEQP